VSVFIDKCGICEQQQDLYRGVNARLFERFYRRSSEWLNITIIDDEFVCRIGLGFNESLVNMRGSYLEVCTCLFLASSLEGVS
jgi:hypothetical protein